MDLNGAHPCEIGLQTYAQRVAGLLAAAIRPNDSEGEAPLLPRLNRYEPIGSTARVHFKTVRPVHAATASHLNSVACDTGTWEQAAMFQIEQLAARGTVECYVRNDHLEFNMPYELYGEPPAYEPDFIVRMSNGVHIVVQIKGRSRDDTAAKHQAAQRWVTAVNHLGTPWQVGFPRLPRPAIAKSSTDGTVQRTPRPHFAPQQPKSMTKPNATWPSCGLNKCWKEHELRARRANCSEPMRPTLW